MKISQCSSIGNGCLSLVAIFLHLFKSIDYLTNEYETTNYRPKFLNSSDKPGLPLHNLQLKVGTVFNMLRNLNQQKLYNGMRLVMIKLKIIVFQATIVKRKFKDEEVLIPVNLTIVIVYSFIKENGGDFFSFLLYNISE